MQTYDQEQNKSKNASVLVGAICVSLSSVVAFIVLIGVLFISFRGG